MQLPGARRMVTKCAAHRGRDQVLGPVLAFGGGQALAEIGQARVHERVALGDAEVERPALGRLHAADGIGAHDAPAGLGAVAIEHVLIEPDLGRAEVAAEHAQVQRRRAAGRPVQLYQT